MQMIIKLLSPTEFIGVDDSIFESDAFIVDNRVEVV